MATANLHKSNDGWKRFRESASVRKYPNRTSASMLRPNREYVSKVKVRRQRDLVSA